MLVGNMKNIEAKVIESPLVKDTSMKVLVSPKEGWEGHVMRVLEVKEYGFTPKHKHPWPHINYIIQGEGELMINGEFHQITSGSYAYVPAGALHQFKNVGKGLFKFICIVPEEGHQY